MDPHEIAADAKAKAQAALKKAEEMEAAAFEIERIASQFGWKISIDMSIGAKPANAPSAKVSESVSSLKRRGGKTPDPNSATSRSKTEAVKIIQELKRPVPLGELAKHLAKRGIVLGGKNPNQALSANLCSSSELVSTRRGWWLAGRPEPSNMSSGIGRDPTLTGLN